jgi:hypothetical protein
MIACLMLRKCELKMLNMKRDYRSVIDHNDKTGNDRKTHPYLDEMNELFGLKPTLKHVAVVSSMVKKPNAISCHTALFLIFGSDNFRF